MSCFLKERIKNDIENLTIPIQFELKENVFYFELKIETEVYTGLYRFRIEFPAEYPFKSPRVFCMTDVFHPNVDKEGRVCLKILREGWMPCFDINSIVVSIICCFEYVSGEDALNVEAGDLFQQDYDKFIERVNTNK